MPETLGTRYQPVPVTAGRLELVLIDTDGTPAGMSAHGSVKLLDATGQEVVIRSGNPQAFMSPAWRAAARALLEQLRAEVTARVLGP